MLQTVILSYNHPVITARTTKSALAHFPAEQVAILHNGSLPKVVEQLKAEFPQVEHWEYADNRGYSGGVNRALSRSFDRRDWALLLTNDTELLSFDLSVQGLEPGIYAPLTYLRRRDRIDYTMGYFDSRRARLWHARGDDDPSAVERGVFPYAPGTAFLLHKHVFQSVGPFDESCHTYWEDVDFGARAFKRGIVPRTLRRIEIMHAGGKTTRKDPFYTRHLFQRNRRRISWRHCPWISRPQLALRLSWERMRSTWA